MSSISFWKPVYQLFKPEEPLTKPEELRDFYVQRANSPVERLIISLEMEDDPAKFLLAGHRGGGKTTELRMLEQKLKKNYTVIWVDTETALNRYNIGYAEVVVLIGLKIHEQVFQSDWGLSDDLLHSLEESLKTVVLYDEENTNLGIQVPDIIKKLGLILKQGLTRKSTKSLNIRPVLSEIIQRVNAIIEAAEKQSKQKLVVIVDGLDRHDFEAALEMFSSRLMIELSCHLVYSIPIALRYSASFQRPMQSFQKCLDLANPPVFECDENFRPTLRPNQHGRDILINVIKKRLTRLGDSHKDLFNEKALELICEKSGGVIRDLVRIARNSCEVASRKDLRTVDLDVANEAIEEVRKDYTISDYHFPLMDEIHRTGESINTKTYTSPNKTEFVIRDELLQNKFVLGYYHEHRNWFDVNPILLEDLERWKSDHTSQLQ